MRVHLDFETRSLVDLKVVGGASYARHPSTSIMCAAYAVDDSEVRLIDRATFECVHEADLVGADVSDEWEELKALAGNPDAIFVAHTAPFEQEIWAQVMTYLGMPEIPIDRWECTMARAYAQGLPGSLDGASKAMHLTERKDNAGKAIMLKLSKPRKITKTNDKQFWEYEDCPEDFETMYEYCKQDVIVERALDNRLRPLSKRETAIWRIDQRMNRDGIRIDMPLVEKAIQFINIQKERDLNGFAEATGGELYSPGQTKKLLPYLQSKGLNIRNLKADTIDNLLAMPELSEELRNVLELRSSATKTSLAKYNRIIEVASMGRIRRLLQYHGARTGRWTGRDVQLHNLVRPFMDSERVIAALRDSFFDAFDIEYPINAALASSVRGMFIPDEGNEFLIGDYSQIESKMLAWLAGAEKKLEVFRSGADIYCFNASQIYGREIDPTMKKERSTGKVAELALGYEGGIGAIVTMAAQARVSLAELVSTFMISATTEEMDYAAFDYLMYCKRTEAPVSRAIGVVCSLIKYRWRKNNPEVVRFWYDIMQAAAEAVLTGKPQYCGKLIWFMDDIWLYVKLPSGRCMAYPYPRAAKKGLDKKGRMKYELSYIGPSGREGLYGGKLAENVTQAAARDPMADGMIRLENIYPVCLTVHDEIISQAKEGTGNLKIFEEAMVRLEKCYEGLPLTAKVHKAMRYGKDD